jgi:hypothetical protein
MNEDQTSNNSYLVIDPTGKYGIVFFATKQLNDRWQCRWALVVLMREVGYVNELPDNFLPMTGYFI